MKFTKEEALESIKSKFVGKSGKTSSKLSDMTISDTIESLLKLGVANEETELSDFVDKSFDHFKTMNENLIKLNSDFAKGYKPEPSKQETPTSATTQFAPMAQPEDGLEKFKSMMKEFLDPVINDLKSMKQEKSIAERNLVIDQMVSGLKLSKEWAVDFGNAREIAVLKLGENASAEDIYNEAYKRFGETLSAKGQTYKPADGSGSQDGKEKTQTASYLEKFKEEQKQVAEKSEQLSKYLGLNGQA